MNRFWLVLLGCCLMLFSCQDTVESFTEKDMQLISQELEGLSNTMYNQYNNQDVEGFLGNFEKSKALTVMVNDRVIKSWDRFSKIEREAWKDYQTMKVVKKELQIDVLTPEMAIVIHSYVWSGVHKTGEAQQADGVLVLTYYKNNGEWKIILWSDHYKLIPKGKPE